MGRALKEINKKEFEKLCSLQCTEVEICDWFDCCEDTLVAWCQRTYGKNFSEVFQQKRAGGKISLRRTGWKMAEENPAVWIFHAKNHLGMSDKPEPDKPAEDTAKNLADALKILRGEMAEPGEGA